MNDLKKYMGINGSFRAFIVDSTNIGRELYSRIQPYPLALNILTQAVTSAVLMACDMKTRGSISLKATGDGPMRHITVEANSDGEARGYCGEPLIEVKPDTDSLFSSVIGNGELTVRKRTGHSDKIHTSVIALKSGGWAENMTRFYLESEQLSSGMKLGAQLDAEHGVLGSGGLLIMAMPDADPTVLETLEHNVRNLKPLGNYFSQKQGHDLIYNDLFEGLDVIETSSLPVCYRCNCSRQRVLDMLKSLPADEINDMRDKGDTIKINCVFCSKKYQFNPEDL